MLSRKERCIVIYYNGNQRNQQQKIFVVVKLLYASILCMNVLGRFKFV